MTPLDEKIKELLGDSHIDNVEFDYAFATEKMKLLARWVYNELHQTEATGEIEPWGTKEQQKSMDQWAGGFNSYRDEFVNTGFRLGILKK